MKPPPHSCCVIRKSLRCDVRSLTYSHRARFVAMR
jgi:hypothetical protein